MRCLAGVRFLCGLLRGKFNKELSLFLCTKFLYSIVLQKTKKDFDIS
jgi:hypothetical protein